MSLIKTSRILIMINIAIVVAVPARAAAPPEAGAAAGAVAPADGPPEDVAASAYATRCAGCHTLGGGAMKGPDLKPATQWAPADLRAAIKRMEKNAGPISEADLDLLTRLLKDPQAGARLDAQRQRATAVLAATLDPADAAVGEALFYGEQAFAKRGLACAACHRVGDAGGALGPDLTRLSERMPKAALVSAFEGANYPIMKPAYAAHPVTPQEAVHLAAFFTERAPARTVEAGDAAAWVAPVGALAGLLAVLLIGLTTSTRGPAGVRARLVRDAQRKAP